MADLRRVRVERDSRKDEAVVFVFIFATAGLLIYAAVRPWVERWVEVSAVFRIACGGLKAVADGRGGRLRGRGGAICLFRVRGTSDRNGCTPEMKPSHRLAGYRVGLC